MIKTTTIKQKERGLFLGITILALQLGLMTGALLNDLNIGSVSKGTSEIITGIYIQVGGVLFLASYYVEHKSFLFRGLIWICENASTWRTRKMAFFFAALCILVGTGGIVMGISEQ